MPAIGQQWLEALLLGRYAELSDQYVSQLGSHPNCSAEPALLQIESLANVQQYYDVSEALKQV